MSLGMESKQSDGVMMPLGEGLLSFLLVAAIVSVLPKPQAPLEVVVRLFTTEMSGVWARSMMSCAVFRFLNVMIEDGDGIV